MKRILGIAALLLVACGNDAPVAKIVEIDKKMPLQQWPDEHYIAAVDSIIAAEKVIPGKDSGKTKLTLNAFKAPSLALPSKTGQKQASSKNGEKRRESVAKEKVDNSAEVFMDKFSRALSALQSDPSNAKLYKTVEAKDGRRPLQTIAPYLWCRFAEPPPLLRFVCIAIRKRRSIA
jgi:hypothetical protein